MSTKEHHNRIALRAAQAILQAAAPCRLKVGPVDVDVSVKPGTSRPWPGVTLAELDEPTHGPWPETKHLQCTWPGGGTTLELAVSVSTRSDTNVAVSVRDQPTGREVTFINLAKIVRSAVDVPTVPTVPIFGYFSLRRRLKDDPKQQEKRNRALKELVADSGLPLLSTSSVDVAQLRLEDAALLPSPEEAYRRLVHVSLFKLDFLSRGPRAAKRGKPLFDLPAMGLGPDDADAEDDDDDEREQGAPEAGRKYWAGGFGEPDRLAEFTSGSYWQLAWSKDDSSRGARLAWSRLRQIQPGDWFAIKGYGGSHQLQIHFVGEVVGVDEDAGRVQLEELTGVPRFQGEAPRGAGARSWRNTLIPVERPDILEKIFGVERAEESEGEETKSAVAADLGPKNVILYGPPGTGKTYRLSNEYFARFTRTEGGSALDVEALEGLTWFEVIAAALADLPRSRGKVADIEHHPFFQAKWQAKGYGWKAGAKIWGTLQSHTVEASQTVAYGARSGRLVFDKAEDSTWFFPGGVPEDIAELATSLQPRPATVFEDHVFATFHQSYAYEDFIEGIRPKTIESEGERPSLVYELEDGVFLRASSAAVKLAGFAGTVDDVCKLPAEERRAVFASARPYAVFVDEINRGNVSRIFGELITLLEEDKRIGEPNEVIVTLPYSRRRFGVPPNLHLIGTMNTADRSVEALDTALRRRFAFIECAPDPSQLEDIVVGGGVEVARMLRTINQRLEVLVDRDHLIGHAYFMALEDDDSIDALKSIFDTKILPLLSEYFYADLGRIGLVLGKPFVQAIDAQVSFAAFDHDAADQLAERRVYRLTPIAQLSTADFRAIYETGA